MPKSLTLSPGSTVVILLQGFLQLPDAVSFLVGQKSETFETQHQSIKSLFEKVQLRQAPVAGPHNEKFDSSIMSFQVTPICCTKFE